MREEIFNYKEKIKKLDYKIHELRVELVLREELFVNDKIHVEVKEKDKKYLDDKLLSLNVKLNREIMNLRHRVWEAENERNDV